MSDSVLVLPMPDGGCIALDASALADARRRAADLGFGNPVAAPSAPAAEALVQKAHVVCPYSHAIKNTIDVRLKVV
jgi:hypothetical protein